MSITQEIIQGISHLFFPHICAGCGSDLPSEQQFLCTHCFHELPHTNFDRFPGNPVEKIFWGRVPVISATAHYFFSKRSALQQVMHQFKYQGNQKIGIYFGRLMGESICNSGRFNSINAVIPLPLHPSRQKKRGYNQAGILSEGIAEIMQLPVLHHAITRVLATETQTHKSRINRWQNIEGKFQLTGSENINNMHLLLVDDIITTGATLDACANTLLQERNVQVSIAALAYTESSV